MRILFCCLGLIWALGWSHTAFGQLQPGYVVVSTTESLGGEQRYFASCSADEDCDDTRNEQCTAVPNIGDVCLALDMETAAPNDLVACSQDSNSCALQSYVHKSRVRSQFKILLHTRKRGIHGLPRPRGNTGVVVQMQLPKQIIYVRG